MIMKWLMSIWIFVYFSSISFAKPLKIYILAGQSNMEGHAKVETFGYIGEDPKTAPILREMTDESGEPKICDQVWISYFTGSQSQNGEGYGKLTSGYGSRRVPSRDGGKIGPEFTFGIYMDKAVEEPILIIKTAWGGKSLHTDYRSPSAGPYVFSESQLEHLKKRGKDLSQIKAEKDKATGHYYRLMIQHIKHVLSDIKRVYPDYDSKAGYELAGFVWFQGWNDMVDSQTYPERGQPGSYSKYSDGLSHFIRDVRNDLNATSMKFVIGVMGVSGPLDNFESPRIKGIHNEFRKAMAAPTQLSEFKGNVVAVETSKAWDQQLEAIGKKQEKVKQMSYFLRSKHKQHANADGKMSNQDQKKWMEDYRAKVLTPEEEAIWKRATSNAGYHYYGCAKIMALIGKSFAEAMIELEGN